jgi:FKBP-type peptidyl-prolyl cis-trans isomerase FkpA
MKKIVVGLLFLVFSLSCSRDTNSTADFTVKNEEQIKEYIIKNKLTAQRSATGLYYVINSLGTGKQPTSRSFVTVAYKGYFTDGKIFDQSKDSGIDFGLQQVIKGWTEGITYFKEGGNGILLVPAHLGYGSNANGPIPGGSVLIFDVKLISVN